MARATDDLRRSGVLDRVLKGGEPAPMFTLRNEQGRAVSSHELLRRGPLVISFYRGMW